MGRRGTDGWRRYAPFCRTPLVLALSVVEPPLLTYRRVWMATIPEGNVFASSREFVFANGTGFVRSFTGKDSSVLTAIRGGDGHPLWRRRFEAFDDVRLVAADDDLLLVGRDEIWQLDPRTGQTVWQTQTSPDGVGPFLSKGGLVAEITWGKFSRSIFGPIEFAGRSAIPLRWVAQRDEAKRGHRIASSGRRPPTVGSSKSRWTTDA